MQGKEDFKLLFVAGSQEEVLTVVFMKKERLGFVGVGRVVVVVDTGMVMNPRCQDGT